MHDDLENVKHKHKTKAYGYHIHLLLDYNKLNLSNFLLSFDASDSLCRPDQGGFVEAILTTSLIILAKYPNSSIRDLWDAMAQHISRIF